MTVSNGFHLGILHRNVGPDNSLQRLKILKLENCNPQSHAIPSNVLPYIKNLRELQVKNSSVKVIFNINDAVIEGTTFQLKKLTLEGLPKLTHVCDKNPQENLIFQNLQEVHVTNCDILETLFPAALAKYLKNLEKLDIRKCEELLEIVGKEEAAAEATQECLFPCLTSLKLYLLPKLTRFCPETLTLQWLEINSLDVLFCDKLELFQSHHEGLGDTSTSGQPLFLDKMVISNLEVLTLNGKDTRILCDEQLPEVILHKLNELRLCFGDANEESTLLFEFLRKAPNLEYLQVRLCRGLKEFSSQKLEMLVHLETLYLFQLFELKSIGIEYSPWLNGFCEKLHKLIVDSCPHLTTLVHSAVSFSNLKELQIFDCQGLKYLFTSSAAKKLSNLQEMEIRKCDSMEQIFAEEQDETTSDKIELQLLSRIILNSLPSLKCFYKGKQTLQFPSLIQVLMWECPKMQMFSEGLIHAESFCGVQFNEDQHSLFCYDLNSTVKRLFLQQANLNLGDSSILRKIWLKEIPVRKWFFSNLKILIVEGCQFLSNAVLPSHLLPFLSKLEELKVRKCDSVKAVFDVKDTPTHHSEVDNMGPASPLSLPLKKLTLQKLPILKHIWIQDPQGSVSLPFLEEVMVEECTIIKSLFPASVAKHKLKTLEVRDCGRLVEIVANDEAATERAMKELTMFPNLTLLRLQLLPNLKCIYPGMHNLKWPMLKEIDVFHCQMLKIFATRSQNCPNSSLEGQNHFAADPQSVGKFSARGGYPHSKVKANHQPQLQQEFALGLQIACQQETLEFKPKSYICHEQKINQQKLSVRGGYPHSKVKAGHQLQHQQEFTVGSQIVHQRRTLEFKPKSYICHEQEINQVTPCLEKLSLSKEDTMMIEQGQLQVDLQELKDLALQCFYYSSDVFPYAFLSKVQLPKFAMLRVVHSAFKEIFPSQKPDVDCSKIFSQLKGLKLENLFMLSSIGLEHSWMGPFPEILETLDVMACDRLENLAPSTLSFSHLSVLKLHLCHGLKYLFTSSTAKSLVLLKEMYVANCQSIEEILAKERNEPSEDDMIFGQLEFLFLIKLPNLGSFYSGSSTLKFPSLKKALFNQCHGMKFFCHGEVVPKTLLVKIDGAHWNGDLNDVISKRHLGEGSSQSQIVDDTFP